MTSNTAAALPRRLTPAGWALILLLAALPLRWAAAQIPPNGLPFTVDAEILWLAELDGAPVRWGADRSLMIYITPNLVSLLNDTLRPYQASFDGEATLRRAAQYAGGRLGLAVQFVSRSSAANVVIGRMSTWSSATGSLFGPGILAATSGATRGGGTRRVSFARRPSAYRLTYRALRDLLLRSELAQLPGSAAYQANLPTLLIYSTTLHELLHVVGFDHPTLPAQATAPMWSTYLSVRAYYSSPTSVMGAAIRFPGEGMRAVSDLATQFMLTATRLRRWPVEGDLVIQRSEVAAFNAVNGASSSPVPAAQALRPNATLFCVAPPASSNSSGLSRPIRSADSSTPQCSSGTRPATVKFVTVRNLGNGWCLQPYTLNGQPEEPAWLASCYGKDEAPDVYNLQKFETLPFANDRGWVQMRSLLDAKCLDASTSPVDRGLVHFTPCGPRVATNAGQAFIWHLNPDGSVDLKSAANPSLWVTYDTHDPLGVGPWLYMSSVGDGRETKWSVANTAPTSVHLHGLYSLRDASSGTAGSLSGANCLGLEPDEVLRGNAEQDAQNRLSSCQLVGGQVSGAQSWVLDDLMPVTSDVWRSNGGLYQIAGADGRCLSPNKGGSSATPEVPFVRVVCDESRLEQRWLLLRSGAGSFTLLSAEGGAAVGAKTWEALPVEREESYSSGLYRFTAQHSRQELAYRAQASQPSIVQRPWSSNGNTLWQVVPRGEGQYELHSFIDERCATTELTAASTYELTLSPCAPEGTDLMSQRFYLPGFGTAGLVQSVLTGRVLDVVGKSQEPRASVTLWTVGGSAGESNQLWTVQAYDGGRKLPTEQPLWIEPLSQPSTSGAPGLCVELPYSNTAPGTALLTARCWGGLALNQLWVPHSDPDGGAGYTITSLMDARRCVSVPENQVLDDSSLVTIENCVPGLRSQLWQPVSVGSSGGVALVNLASGHPLYNKPGTNTVEQASWEVKGATEGWKWFLALSPPTTWTDLAVYGMTGPVRAQNNQVQCASSDQKECLWNTRSDQLQSRTDLRPLQCTKEQYDEPGHWCRVFVLKYQGTQIPYSKAQ